MSRSALNHRLRHPDRWWRKNPGSAPRLLRDSGSLTAAVRALCRCFGVRVCFEGWRRANEDERRLLLVRRNRLVWVREVVLGDGETPLVFAHSVAAADSLPRWPWLRGLGRRPLGEVLFRHPRVIRLPLRFRRLDERHPLYHSARSAAAIDAGVLPARRSLFRLDGRDLLVTEVFLPALLDRLRPK